MSEELIYLYRRKGQDAWVTCDAERYAELSTNHFFDVRVARDQYDYAALETECERLREKLAETKEQSETRWAGYVSDSNLRREIEAERDAARAQLAAIQGGTGEVPEVLGIDRYRVEPRTNGFWPFCVKAGDGERELHYGYRKDCDRVALALACAFEDGKFIAQRITAAMAAEVQRRERWNAVCGHWQDTTLAIHGERTGHIASGIDEDAAHAIVNAHNEGLPPRAAASTGQEVKP